MKDNQQAAETPKGKTGYPSLEFPIAGYTNKDGQPRVLIISHVHEPGDRDEATGKGQLVNGYLFTEPGDQEGFTGAPVYCSSVPGGTRGEPGTWHFLDPLVKV